ncbi:hypothetical protein [Oceanobacillus senegalensis]|uniref:hypothetical protein n=1 Tax=Oceanobacillus senegalensis TaxID=1936063 RepID=UPI000A30A497|nr:hypothetical protein [Oceanobacillus senegalensis]
MKYFLLICCMAILLVGCNNVDEEAATFELRNVDVNVDNKKVHVTAEANVSGSEIYYRMEQGEEVLKEEQKVEVDKDTWVDIEIKSIITERVGKSEEPPVIVIYSKDGKGKMLNPNYIPIDIQS